MQLYVQYDSFCIDSEEAEEQYGSWWESWQFTVGKVYASDKGLSQMEVFAPKFEFEVNDKVYVLWMTFGDGDSFGSASGKGEVLWVFKNEQIAKEAQLRVMHACRFGRGVPRGDGPLNQLSFRADDGSFVQMSNPAGGYFNSCEQIELSEKIVNP